MYVYIALITKKGNNKPILHPFKSKKFKKIQEIEKIECVQRKRFHALKIKESLPFGGIQKIGVERKKKI